MVSQGQLRETLAHPMRRRSDVRVRIADAMAQALVDCGVEVVFGIPGGPIAPLNDAFIDQPAIRHITTRHENGAAFAAAGYAHISGNIGVVLVTSGPGILNAMTGIASAYCDGLPLLFLVGEVARHQQGKGALQDGSAHSLNILAITSPITKRSFEMTDANAAIPMLRNAINIAQSGRPGPVVLTLPMDILSSKASIPLMSVDVSTVYTIQERVLRQIAQSISKTCRGVIYAGSGTRRGHGPGALRKFAEHIQWPVITSPKAKGIFPESHPLSLGVFGMGGHVSSTTYLEKGVDTVLVLGTGLGDLSTDGKSPLIAPNRTLIHVDIDAGRIGRTYASQIAINLPVDVFLKKVFPLVHQATCPKTFGVTTHWSPKEQEVGAEGRINPARAVWEIQQLMPKNTIFAVDSGEHYFFATHFLKINRHDSYMVMSGLGSMGSGICGAIGAKLACPGRPVAVICGDGGLAMVAGEIATAVQAKLPIVFFVFNDQRLGMVELGHQALYGRAPKFASTTAIDIATAVTGMGAQSCAVSKPTELQLLTIVTQSTHVPWVVDIRIDRSITMPKNRRFDSLKKIT